MSLKPWGELTVNERHKFFIQARRNPRKAYEDLVKAASSTPQPEETPSETG